MTPTSDGHDGLVGDHIDLTDRADLLAPPADGRLDPADARSRIVAVSSAVTTLRDEGRYGESEALLLKALTLAEQSLPGIAPERLTLLYELANMYQLSGRLHDAETFYRRALASGDGDVRTQDPRRATALHNLALVCEAFGRNEEAEALWAEARVLLGD